MAYRDDRHALELQLAELERENEELRAELSDAREKARQAREPSGKWTPQGRFVGPPKQHPAMKHPNVRCTANPRPK